MALSLNPNPLVNHVTFSETTRPLSHSFGQVSLPRKSDTCSSSSSSRQIKVTSATVSVPFSDLLQDPTTRPAAGISVAGVSRFWRQIHGCNDWEHLIEPGLHPLLRREIIRYGEFVTGCYKAFDLNPNSKRYLTCKFGKKNLLKHVGLENSGYQVTKYIYATPDVNIPIQNSPACGRWIGYAAVSSDEATEKLGRRDIVITFRGTVTNSEWIANLMSSLTPANLDPHIRRPDVKVESGFLTLYTSDESYCKFGLESCREQLLSEISRLMNKYKDEELSITLAGHSMGSALAVLLAYDIAELGLNRRAGSYNSGDREKDSVPVPDIPVTVFSFGGPRVGNSGFKQRCEELGVKVLRIVNVNDPITKMPGVLFNENFRVLGGILNGNWSLNSCYEHVGVELVLDFFNVQNPSCVHDLETYISLLRCPKPEEEEEEMEKMNGAYFFNRALEFLTNNAQSLNMFPWRNGFNMMGQSQNYLRN